jgi:predicted ATPase
MRQRYCSRRCFHQWSLSTHALPTATLFLSHPTALAGRSSERFYATDKSADKAIHRPTNPTFRAAAAAAAAAAAPAVLVHDDYWVSSVASGRLRQDAAQRNVARRLQRLQIALQSYNDNTPIWKAYRDYLYQQQQQSLSDAQKSSPGRQRRENNDQQRATTTKPGSFGSATTASAVAQETQQPSQFPSMPSTMKIPKGLYLHGSVGTGKSMLVDAFYHCVVGGNDDDMLRRQRQRRYHYHEFLHDIHERLHAISLQRRKHGHSSQPSKLPSSSSSSAVSEPPPDLRITKPQDSNATHNNDVSTNMESLSSPAVVLPSPLDIQPTLNPVVTVALAMAEEYTLLCIDEFSVVDIADVVLWSQLLPTLLRAGTVLVITSNRSMAQIGQDWQDSTPMAAMLMHSLRHHCIEHDMNSTVDYRQLLGDATTITTAQEEDGGGDLSQPALWVVPQPRHGSEPLSQSAAAQTALQKFLAPTFGHHVVNAKQAVHLNTGFQRTMPIQGLSLTVNKTGLALSIACCTFDELCSGRGGGGMGAGAVRGYYYGPSDYRALARNFDALVLENIPVLSNSRTSGTSENHWRDHNQARRFITLVDELYEAQTLVVGSSMAPIAQLFVVVESRDNNPDDTNSVKELQFAFRRAASRLVELTSHSKWESLLRGKEAPASPPSGSAF